MPTYEHLCKSCGYEWDDFYSIMQDPPTLCPECGVDGQVKRLISGGSGRGIVVLTGHDLAAHCKAEGKKMAKAAIKDEKLKANLIGEDRYHQQCLNTEKLTDDLVKIGKGVNETKSSVGSTTRSPKKGVIRRVDK